MKNKWAPRFFQTFWKFDRPNRLSRFEISNNLDFKRDKFKTGLEVNLSRALSLSAISSSSDHAHKAHARRGGHKEEHDDPAHTCLIILQTQGTASNCK